MNERDTKAYERIKSAVPIDMARIDEHIIALPMLLMEAGELCGRAIRTRQEAEHELKVSASMAADLLRSANEKISEARIASEIPLNEDYDKARRQLETARSNESQWQTLVDAIRMKQSALKMTTDLIVSGYLTSSSVAASGRAEMAQQRIERRRVGT